MTDPTYKTLDKQTVFDFVARKIIKQGGQARNRSGICAYRAEGNRKCALGWLIPDDEYDPRMEACTLTTDTGRLPNAPDFEVPVENRQFIRALQVAHDASSNDEFSNEWDLDGLRLRLHMVASMYSLMFWSVDDAIELARS